MSRLAAQWRLVFVAMLSLGIGALAISQTSQMSELGRVFPMTAGLIAIVAGLGVLVQALLSPREGTNTSERVDYVRAGVLSITLIAWALFLEPLGFLPTSGVAVVIVAIIARREPMSARSVVLHAIAGVMLVAGFSVLLSEVLNVRLP